MRLTCPICGDRDLREFTYRGAATLRQRPAPDAGADAFHTYLHVRENPAGSHRELWQHDGGCRAWLEAVRDTRTHVFGEIRLAREEAE